MDGFTISLIIKQLLASAGLKATLALVSVGGFFFLIYKAAKVVGGFFERMISNRDAMLDRLARDLAAMEVRRSGHEVELAHIMATMRANTDSQLNEARDTRKEMHQRFNKVQEDLTWVRGSKS